MSSGERGKPAATYKEKNPFDISRRSETEVAAEIAQRMVAWKQARRRSHATPSAAGGNETKPQPSQPHIAAPVQPARLPKIDEPVTQRQQPGSASGDRIPLFAIRRAMPAAPSLKQPAPKAPAAPAPTPADPAVEKLKIDSLEIAAPLLETLVARHPGTEAAKAAAEALRTQRASADPAPQVEPPRAASVAAPEPELGTPTVALETSEDRIEAPAAAVVGAPGLDMREGDAGSDRSADMVRPDFAQEPADASGGDTSEELATSAETASEPSEQNRIEEAHVAPLHETDERSTRAIEGPELPGDEMPETDSRSDTLVARWEDSVAAVAATFKPDRDADAPADRRDEDVPPAAPTFAEAEHDEHPFSARRNKLTAATALSATALSEESDREPHEPVARPDEPVSGPVKPEAARRPGREPDMEMPRLDAVAMEMHAAELAMAAQRAIKLEEREDPRLDSPQMRAPEPVAPDAERPAAKTPEREITIPADLAAKASSPQIRTRTEGLPRMETRIERRRINVLRADPWIAGRRPVFPHIDPEVWDVPPPEVAARARRQHRGTGWAIGLGTLLLIAGITAPAALWRDRQQTPSNQDGVVALTPPAAVPQPQAQASRPTSPPQAASEEPSPQQGQEAAQEEPSPPQAGQQAAPEEPSPQQATAEPQAPTVEPPAVTAPPVETPSAPPPPASTATASEQPASGTPAPEEATALSAIQNRGELNPAPVTAPPSQPKLSAAVAPSRAAASRPATNSNLASAQQAPDPMVPHPFIPEAAPRATPFRPDQTAPDQTAGEQGAAFGAAAGAAAVADIGMPPQSAPAQSAPVTGSVPVTGGPATIALRPSLSGQLKPAQTADTNTAMPAPARQSVTRKPRPYYPQSLDQMFQNLIDTLSEGQPVNPASKPLPPGNRR
jgi:hypothetical protein